MPGGDRTGPRGMGPRTGRAAGLCSGFQQPGYANPAQGRAFGRGGGGGRGRRNMFYATGLPRWARFGGGYGPAMPVETATETQTLKAHAEALQSELERVNQRINELETELKK